MADSLENVVAEGLGLENLELVIKPQWGSRNGQGRREIRRSLSERVGDEASILDLSQTPRSEKCGISISHHWESGGYLLASSAHVGFDMELNSRVRPELLARVCVEGEQERAPSCPALWTAKEAAFKSLFGVGQPLGLADIEIGSWRTLSPGRYACEICSLNGNDFQGRSRGLVVVQSGECWAFFRYLA